MPLSFDDWDKILSAKQLLAEPPTLDLGTSLRIRQRIVEYVSRHPLFRRYVLKRRAYEAVDRNFHLRQAIDAQGGAA